MFENVDYSLLKESAIELIEQMMHSNDSNLKNSVPSHHPNLSVPPTITEDLFSSVLGDEFHYL